MTLCVLYLFGGYICLQRHTNMISIRSMGRWAGSCSSSRYLLYCEQAVDDASKNL